MSKVHPSSIWQLGAAVSPAEKLVLLALIDYGARIHPSQGTISLKTGLSVRKVGQVIAALRQKGLVRTTQRGAKSLTYDVALTPDRSAQSADHDRHAVPRRSAQYAEEVGTACRGILTNQGTNQPNQGAASAAAVGGGISDSVRFQIAVRDPRGDVDAQHRVVARLLGEHGVTGKDATDAWIALARNWALTGNGAYETLSDLLRGMVDVRDPAAVLMYRIRRLAA